MNWVRIAAGIMDDPAVHQVAETIGTSEVTATGHLVGVFVNLCTHAKDGDLGSVSDTTLEAWARWRGKRGKFAAAFRAQLCDAQGVVRSWEKHNGAALRRFETDRRRKKDARIPHNVVRTQRGTGAEIPHDVVRTKSVTRRDVTIQTTASADAAAVVPRRQQQRPGNHMPDSLAETLSEPVPDRRMAPRRADELRDPVADMLDRVRGELQQPHHIAALEGHTRAARNPVALLAELDATATGMHGPPVPWPVIGQALHELALAGSACTATALRGFVRRILRDAENTPTGASADAPAINDPLYFTAVAGARDNDPEWLAYCAERGIRWQPEAA